MIDRNHFWNFFTCLQLSWCLSEARHAAVAAKTLSIPCRTTVDFSAQHGFSSNADWVIYIFFTVQPHIIQLKNETTYENGQVTLTCEAEGEPIPEITWKRAVDGITFSEGDKVTAKCTVVFSIIVFSVFCMLLNLTLNSNLWSNL